MGHFFVTKKLRVISPIDVREYPENIHVICHYNLFSCHDTRTNQNTLYYTIHSQRVYHMNKSV